MAIRDLGQSNTSLRDSLLEGTPFVYAHLVKFEKPIKTNSGKSARKETDYVYITDGSFDIAFDDGSSDVDGNANGTQIYSANKLLSVGGVSETIEARATSMNLQVSAVALSTTSETFSSFTVTSNSLQGSTHDLVEKGFREGDTVEITVPGGGGNHGIEVRIESFEDDNKTAIVTPINATLVATTESMLLTFKNPEVEGILLDRGQASYARYINRDVFVYKAHINTDTGAIIGSPYLLFKGIIAGGKLTEDPNKSSIISWTLTSHWGDFSRVQGRLTSDPYHRALDQNNIPDPKATIRPEYAGDLGFLHSEQAINLVAIYQVMETRYRLKKKSSFFGLKKSYSMEEYQVQVDREADLRFNLEARYLPVVYGVNKIDSIPVFVDTLNTDSKKVFVAYALCEGQIAGLYDIYFDDTSSICIDENDFDTRSSQTTENTIDVLCQGRADRGDTLTSQNINSTTAETFPGSLFALGNDSWGRSGRREAFFVSGIGWLPVLFQDTPGGASISGAGITHEKGTRFESPIDTRLQFHAGKPNQPANNILLSNADNFKVATDYYSGDDPYWGANHRLLDTAYVVAEYQIGEGETTIPSLEFVVRGKGVECFNYDYSYIQDPAYAGSDASTSAFTFGESVTLKKVSDNSTIGTVTIADIYTITNVDGQTETRIRFTEDPQLGTTTNFYMVDGSSNRFTLVTYDHISTSGTVPSELKHQVSSVSSNATEGIDIDLTGLNAALAAALANGNVFSIFGSDLDGEFTDDILNNFFANWNSGTNTIEGVGTTDTNSSEVVNEYVVSADGIILASNASSADDAYNNYEIELTHKHADGSITVQKRIITDYDGTTRVATVDAAWEIPPHQNDTYKIFSVTNDIRVSTNPAMQLLDYLRSKRYGRDLDFDTDLDTESFFEAARACDTRSDVTMVLESAPTVGDVYELQPYNRKIFQGTVKSVETVTIASNTRYNVVFTDVLGKLGIRWESWKYLFTDEYFYSNGQVRRATSDGILSTFTGGGTNITSITLGRKSGTGPSSIAIDFSGSTFEGNPLVKYYNSTTNSYTSGYTLYDSDDVKYWRYLGWEAQNQRHVTRHQTNAVIDTSKSIFDNINSMLAHFNGILRYSGGKYSLAVKTQAAENDTTVSLGGVTYSIEKISEDDIIGSINIEDAGQKGTYNQVDVTINDPQNRFEGRQVMMFNSDYLKEDRMVPKKGSVRTPYITNYYNARINAKQYLEESRAGLKINFTMAPRGILLRAGDIIQVEYPRFGWSQGSYGNGTLFRITNLNITENCLIQVTAEEHSEEAFLIASQEKGGILPVEGPAAPPAAPTPPTNLSATQSAAGSIKTGAIELTWANSSNFKAATYSTQIWGNTTNNRNSAVLLATTKASRYVDSIPDGGVLNKYYWVRHVVTVPPQTGSQVGMKEIFSAYEPSNPLNGALGSINDGRNINLDLDNDAIVVGGTEGTSVTGFSEAITATVYAGTEDDTSNWTLTWVVDVAVTNTSLTGVSSGTNNEIYTVTALNNGSSGEEFTFATITVTATRTGYTTRQKTLRVTKILNGEDGVLYKVVPNTKVVKYDPNAGIYEGGSGANNNEVTFSFLKIEGSTSNNFPTKYSLDGGSTILPASGITSTSIATTLTDGGTESVRCRLYSTDGSTYLGEFEDVSLIKDGLSARQVSISAAAQNFIKTVTPPSTVDYSPDSIALEARKLGGVTGTANWSGATFYSEATLINTVTSGDTVYIGPSAITSGNTTVTISLSVTDTSITNGLTYTDSEEIGLLVDGSDVISMSLTNDSVEIPTDSNGENEDFGNTSTNIIVYEGATRLTYAGADSNQTLSVGTFVLTNSDSGVSSVNTPANYDTTSSGNSSTSPATGGIDDITGDQGSVTFTARARRADGNVVSGVSKVQTFSKIKGGAPAPFVVQVFLLNNSSTAPSPPQNNTTYDFSNGSITLNSADITTGWSTSRSSTTLSNRFLWAAEKKVNPPTSGSTVTIASGDWSVTLDRNYSEGANGAPGPKIYSGYLYYQDTSSTAPTAPSTSSVTMNFTTGVLSGGVIGTGSTNWNQNPPTFVAGNSNKYWYVYYTAQETGTYSNGYPSQSITFGTVVYQGMGFSGLVTFASDGDLEVAGGQTYDAAARINNNTTTINGGKITTGTIAAEKLTFYDSANSRINVSSFFNDENYQDSTQVSSAISTSLSGYLTTSAANSTYLTISTAASTYQAAGSYLTTATTGTNLTNFGSIATAAGIAYEADLYDPNNASGGIDATFKSALTASGLSLGTDFFDAQGNINSTFSSNLTSAGLFLDSSLDASSDAGLSVVNNKLRLTSSSLTLTSSQVTAAGGLTSSTSISAGKISLTSGSLDFTTGTATTNNSIVLESTTNQNRIVIYDGTTPRVIIGKL